MATNHERENALDRNAYMMGRDDARAGLPCHCRAFIHPDNLGAYRAGWQDFHKLQAAPAMLAALKLARDLVEVANNAGAFKDAMRPGYIDEHRNTIAAAIAAATGER